MKKSIIIILSLLFSTNLLATCLPYGLWVFPRGKLIKKNSIFIINAYGASQNIITGLNQKYNIYFKNGDNKIKLNVVEVCIGQFNLTQALLKPETALQEGLEYELNIDSLSEYESIKQFNSQNGRFEPLTYKVLDILDNEKPIITTRPKELYKSYFKLGCGPTSNVVFSYPAKDSSEIIIKTSVKNIKTGKTTTYYIEPMENKIIVGRDMCSGAFILDNSKNYEIAFSFMDASGNITEWSGEKLKFSNPTNSIKTRQHTRH